MKATPHALPDLWSTMSAHPALFVVAAAVAVVAILCALWAWLNPDRGRGDRHAPAVTLTAPPTPWRAPRHSRRKPPMHPVPPMTASGQTMYEQIGGVDALRAAVEQFYQRLLADEHLAPYFAGVDLHRLKRHQALLLGQVLGGPVAYDDLSALTRAHAGMSISADAYGRVTGHLFAVLIGLRVPAPIIRHVLGTLVDVADLIIDAPAPPSLADVAARHG